MKPLTYLAFDYGTHVIGVAVGRNPPGRAEGAGTVAGRTKGPDWPAIERLLAAWEPDALIVGLPLNMDGTDNEMTVAARRFSRRLDGRYHLPVYLVDERLTTASARDRVVATGVPRRRRKAALDTLAAITILQAYFDDLPHTGPDHPRDPIDA